MEKEISELKEQRDLAQSRVEDLLRMIEDDQKSRKVIFYFPITEICMHQRS